MEESQKELQLCKKTSHNAVKIALISCVITIIFATLSLWVLLNQITATDNLLILQKNQAKQIQILEEKIQKN